MLKDKKIKKINLIKGILENRERYGADPEIWRCKKQIQPK